MENKQKERTVCVSGGIEKMVNKRRTPAGVCCLAKLLTVVQGGDVRCKSAYGTVPGEPIALFAQLTRFGNPVPCMLSQSPCHCMVNDMTEGDSAEVSTLPLGHSSTFLLLADGQVNREITKGRESSFYLIKFRLSFGDF
ncbi:hypothetical protein J6590_048698 [Homalodisca vitripennis]|nr:hypothetical protein J6590_048698 [Homalodisca vitripennis]